MANIDRPNGFKPFGELRRVTPYIAGGTIYPGDMVTFTGAGGDNSTTRKGAEVLAAAATNPLVGVALNYAVDGGEVLVADHPDQLFVAQGDDASIADQRDLGLNADILATAGDSTYKRSRQEVDVSTKATTNSLQLQIVRLYRGVVGQEGEFGSFARLVVRINKHQLVADAGVTGI